MRAVEVSEEGKHLSAPVLGSCSECCTRHISCYESSFMKISCSCCLCFYFSSFLLFMEIKQAGGGGQRKVKPPPPPRPQAPRPRSTRFSKPQNQALPSTYTLTHTQKHTRHTLIHTCYTPVAHTDMDTVGTDTKPAEPPGSSRPSTEPLPTPHPRQGVTGPAHPMKRG